MPLITGAFQGARRAGRWPLFTIYGAGRANATEQSGITFLFGKSLILRRPGYWKIYECRVERRWGHALSALKSSMKASRPSISAFVGQAIGLMGAMAFMACLAPHIQLRRVG